ncbi:hypothetical protein [Terrisporobacter glycolicus]|uniref:asparagine synthase (glutamine-hydrolyzing) n=1 Tax=Terrisporobacter glycolicus ATCC 14880 = DSM 1288 TaxID=1121315 RepID=A0ABZ2ES49_9FIRM|nr:hypothetical protein [Terrisporobacter glycolicus]
MHANTKEMIELLEEYPQYRNDIFKRGYLITSDTTINNKEYPFYENWNICKVGDFIFYIHREQKLYIFEENNNIFFLIGHAYNPFTMEIDEISILKKISNSYYRSKNKYFDAVSELTGLFIIGFIENCQIEIIVDCAGMQGAYYGFIDDKVFVSSHMQMIGDLCNLKVDSYVEELINYKFYKLYGPFLPSDLSSYKEVKRLVPNTVVNFKLNKFIVNRFFPDEGLEICESEVEYESTIKEIGKILHNNIELISRKWEKPAISMTGGMDSKVTVACANGLYDKFKYFSYISMPGEVIDAEAAHTIANHLGISHKIYNIPDENSKFKDLEIITKIINHSFGNIGKLNQNDMRKRVYFRDTNEFDIEVKSWVSEIGRANYYKKFGKKRMPKHLSPRNLTTMYKFFVNNRSLVKKTDKVFEEYRDKYKFGENFNNYDESDMFLWEIRYGAWGGLVLTGEHRYSFDITVPYNNRKLIKLLLSLPLNKRINDKSHEDIIKLMNIKVDEPGITIVNYNETKKRMYFEKLYFNLNGLLPF